jgi:hypothetical protein
MVTTTYMERNTGSAEPVHGGTDPAGRTPSPPLAHHAPPPVPQATEFTLPSSTEPDLDLDHDEEAPLRFHRIDNVLGPVVVPGLVERTF